MLAENSPLAASYILHATGQFCVLFLTFSCRSCYTVCNVVGFFYFSKNAFLYPFLWQDVPFLLPSKLLCVLSNFFFFLDREDVVLFLLPFRLTHILCAVNIIIVGAGSKLNRIDRSNNSGGGSVAVPPAVRCYVAANFNVITFFI